MDRRSQQRKGLYWACASALVLMFTAAPVFADDEGKRTEEREPYFPEMRNPCTKDPVTMGRTRCSKTNPEACEQITCDPALHPYGCGSQVVTTRTKAEKNGRSETRTRTQASGFGEAVPTTVTYRVATDNLTVMRTTPNTTSIIVRNRDMGNPDRPALPVGMTAGSSCSGAVPTQACASPFVVATRNTVFINFANGSVTRVEPEPDVTCKNRDGRDRRDDED
jgi:hypothetical protein